jgi:SSS family solute:Na+ symporter
MSRKVHSLSDYATGGKSYTAFAVFATLSSSFIGGGFTIGLAEKVFSLGLIYVIALWGFSFKEILIAHYIAPRMTQFREALSVGDIMGMLYGQKVRIFTGFASVLVCAGIAGAQFAGLGYILNVLLGMPQWVGALLGAVLVITYSSLGGMKAVVANDILHFCVLIVALPLVLIFGLMEIGGPSELPNLSDWNPTALPLLTMLGLFLNFFFGETLVPPYVQRLLIGKTTKETAKGTMWSGLLSLPFFLMIGFIGIIALQKNPGLNPNLALPYVINTFLPIGIKGLVIAGMVAVVMSSADSFLNAAGIAATHDVLKPLRGKNFSQKEELISSRLTTLIVGVCGIGFALSTDSVIDILLETYNFWTPFILVPLVGGILGFTASSRVFWIASFVGMSSVFLARFYAGGLVGTGHFDAAIIGITTNFLTFTLLRRVSWLQGATQSLSR